MVLYGNVDAPHIILGVVVSLVLGSLWYSSFMFGNCTSTPTTAPQKPVALCFLLELLNSSMGTWALFALLNFVEPQTLQENLYIGLLICLASAVPSGLAKYIWKSAPLSDVLVSAGFSVALTASLILARSLLV